MPSCTTSKEEEDVWSMYDKECAKAERERDLRSDTTELLKIAQIHWHDFAVKPVGYNA